MSEKQKSAANLSRIALIVALGAGGLAIYQSIMATRTSQEITQQLKTIETTLEAQKHQLASAESALTQLRTKLTQTGSATDLQALAEQLQLIGTKALRFESIANTLAPLEEQLGSMDALGDALAQMASGGSLSNVVSRVDQVQKRIDSLSTQNDELIRYIDQRIRSVRTITDKLLPIPGNDDKEYAVEPGDTLETIANELGFSLRQLMQANPKVSAKRLQIGQELSLPTE
jgi:LysM repeat protein